MGRSLSARGIHLDDAVRAIFRDSEQPLTTSEVCERFGIHIHRDGRRGGTVLNSLIWPTLNRLAKNGVLTRHQHPASRQIMWWKADQFPDPVEGDDFKRWEKSLRDALD